MTIVNSVGTAVATLAAAVAGGVWSASVNAATAQGLADGSYMVMAGASDIAGNPAAPASRSLAVAKTRPTIAITDPIAGNNTVDASEAAAGFTVSGTTSGVEDGQTVTVTLSPPLGCWCRRWRPSRRP